MLSANKSTHCCAASDDEPPRPVEGHGVPFVPRSEYEHLREQLQDTRQLLQEAERRYQQEKRELLNLRTAQLRNETSKRGQEGEIIARAMQVMSEYETVVRSSEEASLARLAHHMETLEKEWIRRSREFEEHKNVFETSMMEKLRQTLGEHERNVELVARSLLERSLQTLCDHSAMRLEVEQQVMRHAETFKEEYKAILEKEFYDRCKMFDQDFAERERNWLKVLQEERKSIIAAEQEAMKKHERLHDQSLEDAMRDLSRLREQLVREHQEQQTEAMRELIARREELQQEHEKLIEAMNKKTHEMHQKCIADVVDVQNKMKEMHVCMAAKEAEMAMRVQEAERKSDKAALDEIMQVRKEVEQQWFDAVEKERAKCADEVQRVKKEYQAVIDRIRNEQTEREGALFSSYEQRVVQAEEAAESRWSGRMAEAMLELERHLEALQQLRRENEAMAARIDALSNEVQLKAVETEGALGRARREQDVVWHRRIEEMRQRYDKLLDEALGSTDGTPHVSQAEYQQVVQSLKEWEEKCVALKQQYELRLEEERMQLHNVWGKRLEEERAQRAEWEAQQLQYFSTMRDAFMQDVEARESGAAAAQRAEREALQDSFLQQIREEKRRSDLAIAQAQNEARERCAAAYKEQEEAFGERTKLLEERIAKWEADVQRREEELHRASLHIADEAHQMGMCRIQEDRQAFQIFYEGKLAELYDEQRCWESKKSTLQQELITQYAELFLKAKTEMRQHLLAAVTTMLSYQEQCEAAWLHTRENELDEFKKERLAYRKLMELQKASDMAALQARVDEIIRSERANIAERERVLIETLQKSQKNIEDGAIERSMALLKEQEQMLYESNRVRAEEQQQLWENMKSDLLEKTWQAEADQRAELQRLRREHESEIEKERLRWRAAEQQLRMEMQTQRQQLVEQLREKEMEMQKNHSLFWDEENRRHEAFVAELRKEHDSRIAEEKRRAELMRYEREAAFDAERKRLLERMDKQSREQQESMDERVRLLQEEFDNLMRTATANSHQSQENYMTQVKELQQRYVRQLEEQKKELYCRHEKSLSEMHAALETQLREQAMTEANMQRHHEDERVALRDEMESKYRAFMEQHFKWVGEEQQMREKKIESVEQMYLDQLAELKNEMGEMLSAYFAQSCSRAEEVATELRGNFERQVNTLHEVLQKEQERSVQLENKLQDARAEIDALQITYQQQKLEALREVQAKYEDVYKEVREALRAEREEWAQRALGEEEKRLLRELTAREERRRRQADALMNGAKETSSTSITATPAAKAAGMTTTGRHLLLSEETPTVLKHQVQRQQQENARLTPQTPRDLTYFDEHCCGMPCDFDDVKLDQLWSVLEVPEAERQQKLRRWSQLPLQQRCLEVQKETRRLELQLPLLEVVTRREFVIHRLKELEKGLATNSVHNREQMEGLQKELLRLTEYLKSEIPRHETTHGCTFRFRGTRYMDTLL